MSDLVEVQARSRANRMMASIVSVLGKTAQILLDNSNVTVRVAEYGPAPAWTNMEDADIYLRSDDVVKEMDLGKLIRTMKGLLYHEVSHLKWSASQTQMLNLNSMLDRNENHGRFGLTHNVLDDKRIENLFVKLYRPGRHYLAAPLYEFIVKVSPSPCELYMNIVGRPWLDGNVLHTARAAAVTAEPFAGWTDSVDRVSTDFIKLPLRTWDVSPKTVITLVREWQKLENALTNASPNGEQPTQHTCGNDELSSTDAGWDADGDLQEKDESLSDEDIENLKDIGNDDAKGDSDDSPEGDNSSSKKDDDDAQTSDEDGGSDGNGGADDTESVMDQVERALDQAHDEITQDVQDTAKAVSGLMGTIDPLAGFVPTWEEFTEAVEPEMRTRSRQIATALQDIRTAGSPEWLHGQPAGRLNVMRAITQPDESMDIFDVYDEGTEDEMRCHISIGIDLSVSMRHSRRGNSSPYRSAAQAAWIMRDAFLSSDHEVDVYGYSYAHQLIKERHDRNSYPVLKPEGGTHPASMLEAIVSRSGNLHGFTDRLCVILTDGLWDGELERVAQAFDAYRSIGGRSLLFLIDDGDATMFKSKIASGQIDEVHPYGVDELHTIETMGDMVTAVQSYVKQQMRGHLK